MPSEVFLQLTSHFLTHYLRFTHLISCILLISDLLSLFAALVIYLLLVAKWLKTSKLRITIYPPPPIPAPGNGQRDTLLMVLSFSYISQG